VDGTVRVHVSSHVRGSLVKLASDFGEPNV
jgi:hypothetical protein